MGLPLGLWQLWGSLNESKATTTLTHASHVLCPNRLPPKPLPTKPPSLETWLAGTVLLVATFVTVASLTPPSRTARRSLPPARQRGGGGARLPSAHPATYTSLPPQHPFAPRLVPDRTSDCFWDLSTLALRILDRRSLAFLTELRPMLAATTSIPLTPNSIGGQAPAALTCRLHSTLTKCARQIRLASKQKCICHTTATASTRTGQKTHSGKPAFCGPWETARAC
jgi:hypothetical protein